MAQRDGRPVLITKDNALTLVPMRLDGSGDSGEHDEAFLQKLLFEHPEVLPLEQIEQAFEEPIPVCREFPTKHGPVDNLFITADGNIVIAEAKLWRNPEARRKVVAQALDYASCIFEMSYSEFEAAALRGDLGRTMKPPSLWHLVPEEDRLPEHEFVDAVARNLRHGRIVVLVVGDGIRSEAERLAESLQSHAGLRFTFALVELSIFTVPGTEHRLVVPRTLAKTQLVERGVVRIDGGNISVAAGPSTAVAATGKSVGGISAEEFFDIMRSRNAGLPDRLKSFLDASAPLGVYPDFRKSLNLKWTAPNGRTINLAIIQRDGQVWTSESGLALGEGFAREYNEALAEIWGGRAEPMPWGSMTKWQARVAGKVPRVEAVAEKLDAWLDVLRRLLPRAAERVSESE